MAYQAMLQLDLFNGQKEYEFSGCRLIIEKMDESEIKLGYHFFSFDDSLYEKNL